METVGPDAVAIPGWSSAGALAVLAWCRDTRTPAVLMSDSVRRDGRHIAGKEWVKSRLVGLFSAAVVAGRPHVDYVVKLGIPPTHVFPGYDVVDNAHFKAGDDAARREATQTRSRRGLPERYFLASSRFIEEKNLERLLDAYARYLTGAGNNRWDLVLLGDGHLRAALERRIDALGIREHVGLPGFRQYGELADYYALAGAFVLASVSDTWGLVVNEAMACGLPVLVSDRCGCVCDLVKDGVNGFRFDPYDVDALASRMAELAGGVHDLAAMGRASREIIADWGPELFAESLRRAARLAREDPIGSTSMLDQALLWSVARR
jgi:glycosyltransferase involved in cell wall biosynthesis